MGPPPVPLATINIARVRNCPDITILNSHFIHGHIHGVGLPLGISHGLGHGVGCVLVMPHGAAHGVSHFQSSFHTNVSKVTICAQILKWQRFLTVILTRGMYRAARAAKNIQKSCVIMSFIFLHYFTCEKMKSWLMNIELLCF